MEKGTYEVKKDYAIPECLLLSAILICGAGTILGWVFTPHEMTKIPPLAAFSSIGIIGFFILPFIMPVRNTTVETPDYKIYIGNDVILASIVNPKLTYLFDVSYIFEDEGIKLLDLNKVETVKAKISYNMFDKKLHSTIIIGSFESKRKKIN